MKLKDNAKIVCVAITKSDKSQEKLAEDLNEDEVLEQPNISSNAMEISEDFDEETNTDEEENFDV